MKSFRRVRQKTGSYCGPAVFEMLLSSLGLKLDQEQMVDACGARSSVMKTGIPLVELSLGLKKLYPNLVVWQKTDAKVSEMAALMAQGYWVGVDWQGIFAGDEYWDDEEDKWEEFWNKLYKLPSLKGSQGHYCVVLELDLKRGWLRYADPYGHYAGKDRLVAIWEFEERWWDDRLDRDTQGIKKYVFEDRLMFIVAKKGDQFPEKLGMVRV